MTKINPNRTIQQNLKTVKGETVDGDYAYGLRDAIHDILDELYIEGDSLLNRASSEAERASNTALSIERLVSKAYDRTKTYEPGDHVLHDGKLYVCVAHTDSGEFVSAQWAEITVSDEVLKFASYARLFAARLSGNILAGGDIIWERGTILDNGNEASTPRVLRSIYYPVGESDYFEFTDLTITLARQLCFYDRSKTFIYRYNASTISGVKAPTGSAYIRFVFGFMASSEETIDSVGRDALLQNFTLKWSAMNPTIELNNVSKGLREIDLNDLITPGTYRIADSSVAETIDHMPSKLGGILIVMNLRSKIYLTQGSDNRLMQVYCTAYGTDNGGVHIRAYRGADRGWTPWGLLLSASALDDKLKNSLSLMSKPEDFTSADDVSRTGFLRFTAAQSKKIENLPEYIGGFLSTLYYSSVAATQTWYSYTNRTFIRYLRSTGWSDWREFLSETPITSKIGPRLNNTLRKMKIPWVATYNTLIVEDQKLLDNKYYVVDTPVSGIIYSSVWREGRDVYWNINLKTYYSSLENPASWQYTKNSLDLGIHNASAWYGGVCSTFVSYVLNFPFYLTTQKLQTFLVEKDIDDIYDIEPGDILLRPGHIALVSNVFLGASGELAYVEVTEQTAPRSVSTKRPASTFLNWMRDKQYRVMQNTFGNPRTFVDPVYASDVLFERGNDTYVSVSELSEMWFNITIATDTIYARRPGETQFLGYSLWQFEFQLVNDCYVYNLAPLFSEVGDYELTTNPDNNVYCLVRVVDPGQIRLENGTLTLSGYSENCPPFHAYLLRIYRDPEGTHDRFSEVPDGYYASPDFDHRYTFENNDTVTLINLSENYKVYVEYDTGLGLYRVFSENIMNSGEINDEPVAEANYTEESETIDLPIDSSGYSNENVSLYEGALYTAENETILL